MLILYSLWEVSLKATRKIHKYHIHVWMYLGILIHLLFKFIMDNQLYLKL